MSIADVKTASDIAANVVTIAAVIVGGAWAYWRFIRERTRWPRATLDLVITHHLVTEATTVLSVKVQVHNRGKGLMKLKSLRIDVYKVLPVAPDLAAKIDAGELIPEKEGHAEWPPLSQKKLEWPKRGPELEPDESDEFCADFSIPSSEEVVFLYVYLENVAKQRGKRELGWPMTSFYAFPTSEVGPTEDHEGH